MEKEYVIIQSNISIRVTPGLQNQDVTNPDAHVADRLKVSPLWPEATVLIRAGQHTYPAYIREWPSVQALAKDKVLTIGETVAEPDDASVKEIKAELDLNIAGIRAKTKKVVSNISLDKLSGEE